MTNDRCRQVERVTHRYGKTFALNDLTLDIPAHCMVGMIGPDGVGKSTLLALDLRGAQDPSRQSHGARRRHGG